MKTVAGLFRQSEKGGAVNAGLIRENYRNFNLYRPTWQTFFDGYPLWGRGVKNSFRWFYPSDRGR
jgi:hypothetical protein